MFKTKEEGDFWVKEVLENMPHKSVADIVAIFDHLLILLPLDDRIRAFIFLYRKVTVRVAEELKRGTFRDPEWVEELIVVFAQYFLDPFENFLCGKPVQRSWQVLFDKRHSNDVSIVQAALAGVCAHILVDLSRAVVMASNGKPPMLWSPRFRDYLAINILLDEVEIVAMREMATGPIKRISDILSPVDRIAAMFVVARCRDVAWINCYVFALLQRLEERIDLNLAEGYIKIVDRGSSLIGRALLIPTESSQP